MTRIKALGIWALILAAVSLSSPPVAAEHRDVRIVASFSILGDMVKEVVGDLATVSTIVGPNDGADCRKITDDFFHHVTQYRETRNDTNIPMLSSDRRR